MTQSYSHMTLSEPPPNSRMFFQLYATLLHLSYHLKPIILTLIYAPTLHLTPSSNAELITEDALVQWIASRREGGDESETGELRLSH